MRATVHSGTNSDLSNTSALALFESSEATIRTLAISRGLEVSLTLAGNSSGAVRDEYDIGAGGWDFITDYLGATLSGDYDGGNDGLLWLGDSTGRVQALAYEIQVRDDRMTVQETVILAVD